MTHVLTSAYLGISIFGSVPWSRYAPYLTWASTAPANADAIAALGIKTMVYSNPNRIKVGQPMYSSDESTFAHDCSGARVADKTYAGLYLMNPASTDLWTLWTDYIHSVEAQGHFDAIFSDDADDIWGISAAPCGYVATNWLNSTISEDAATGAPIVYNGLGLLGSGDTISPSIGLNASASGGMAESCYAPKTGTTRWEAMENTELAMAAQRKDFFCYGNDASSAASAGAARIYEYASFLMTYDPATSMLWEKFATPSHFSVEPESQLVALNPLVPTPTTVATLQVSPNVYAREYAACYLAGKYVGPCATVINADYNNAHAFPYPAKYHHSLHLSGGGVLDGGTVATNGSAPPSTLPPLGSAIVFQ